MAKSFKNTKKGVLFLSKTRSNHRKHISILIFNVYISDYTHQMNINRLKLFGAIVSLIFHLSCIIRGNVETITINSFWKWFKWSLNHLLKNRKYKLLVEQCRGGSMTPVIFYMESSLWHWLPVENCWIMSKRILS